MKNRNCLIYLALAILLLIFCCSCKCRISDFLIITSIRVNDTNFYSQDEYSYVAEINNEAYLYTNNLYKIGDTLK